MGKIFISYRRKESVDITGRLFDRLAGYFGPGSVFMDVDVLISGADYRAQIGKIIEQCDVLLAIVGQQWGTISDDSGQRRLDNPDDQLRIEIATALERGIVVIPVLVHQAQLPGRDDLPDDLAAVAAQEPIEIQSGLPFNTDVQKLVDRLEQQHGLKHPDRRFPLELVLIPLGILLLAAGIFSATWIPWPHMYIREQLQPGGGVAGTDYSLAGYHDAVKYTLLWCTIPLGLGPLLIVAGTRWCCRRKELLRERRFFSSGVGRQQIAKSGIAVACLGLGLAAIGFGALAAIPALLLGIWSFVDTKLRRGWVRGRSLAVFGMLFAVVGGGLTTYLHLSMWRFNTWMSQVDAAKKAVGEGKLDEALSAYQRSIDEYPASLHAVGVSHFKRAEIFEQTGQLESSIQELTLLIERCTPAASKGDHDPAGVTELIRNAYHKRADLYLKLEKPDLSEADRQRALNFMQEDSAPPDKDVIDYYQEDAPEPPAPAAEEQPEPWGPAPVVDPSASQFWMQLPRA